MESTSMHGRRWLLLSYRYHFNRWLAADASYGYAGTHNKISLPLAHSTFKRMCTRLRRARRDSSAPRFRVHPYFLAGAGALVF